MPDTYTPNLNLTKPEVGASDNTWGDKLNTNLDSIDALFTTGPALRIEKGGTAAATAADARTNLGLGTLATQNASSVTVTNLTVNGNLGVKKTATVPLDVNGAVKAASANVTGTLTVGGGLTVSGTLTAGTLAVNTQLTIANVAAFKDSGGNRVLGFSVGLKRTTTQTVNASTESAITWENEEWDDSNMWSSGSNISVPKNGVYEANIQVGLILASGSGTVVVKLYRGASLVSSQSYSVGTSETVAHISALFREASAAQNYSVAVHNQAGANLSVTANTKVRIVCLGTF